MSKSTCPVLRSEFKANATPISVNIDGQAVSVLPREFSTGSFGWHHGEKMELVIGDKAVRVQVGLTMTIIGSKEAE